jgi:tetratricopeptide (TPR) repeat protein
MKRSFSLIAVLLTILIVATAGYAQQPQGSMHGKVLDQDGKPLQGAIARAEEFANHYIGEGKTNKNGEYSIVGLYQGRYKVMLILNNKILMTIGEKDADAIYVVPDRDEAANFDLRKVPAAALAAAPTAPAADPNKGKSKAEIEADKKKNEEMKSAFGAGIDALKAKNYDEAIKQLQLASEKDATQPSVFGNLGVAYFGAKKYDDAIVALRKSIALNPSDAGVHSMLASSFTMTGKIDEAQQEAQEIAKLDPTLAGQTYYNLGAMLGNSGKTKESVAFFKKVIEIDPKNADAYYQLGLSYFGSTDTIPSAIPVLQKYLDLQPSGTNSEAAKQLMAAAKAATPSGNKKD